MYTVEEADSFSFCVLRWMLEPAERHILRALAEAIEQAHGAQGVTSQEVARILGASRSSKIAHLVPKLLTELAGETREHGVPIGVETDPDGTLRYSLTPEQVALLRTDLGRTAPPMYVFSV
jgi:hypothetical protein